MDRLCSSLAPLLACLALTACAGEHALVLELGTDLPLPAADTALDLAISQGGTPLFRQRYAVDRAPADGGQSLPATLVLADADASAPHAGTLIPGLLLLRNEGPLQITVSLSKGDAVQVLRDAQVALPGSGVKVLRMDLGSACVGVTCGAGMTCQAAKCVSSQVDADSLPEP
jgi:hypothetical protein